MPRHPPPAGTQLSAAHVLGRDWIGTRPALGPVSTRLQHPEAPDLLTFHRDGRGRIVIKVASGDVIPRACISTRVDLSAAVRGVLDPYSIEVVGDG